MVGFVSFSLCFSVFFFPRLNDCWTQIFEENLRYNALLTCCHLRGIKLLNTINYWCSKYNTLCFPLHKESNQLNKHCHIRFSKYAIYVVCSTFIVISNWSSNFHFPILFILNKKKIWSNPCIRTTQYTYMFELRIECSIQSGAC